MELEFGLVISQILAFLVLLWIMKKLAWKPFLATLEARRTKIEEQFSSLDKREKDLDQMIADYRQQLAQIEETARLKMAETVAEGQKLTQRIQEEAHAQARSLLERAKMEMNREVEKVQKELKEQMVRVVIGATEKLLNQKIDPAEEQQRITQFLEEVQLREPR